MFDFSTADRSSRGDFDSLDGTDAVFGRELREFAVYHVVFSGDSEAYAVSYAFRDGFGTRGTSIRHGGMEMEVGFVDYGVCRLD